MFDSSKDWSGFPSGCSGTSRWFNVSCTGDPNTAQFYDLIIEGGGPPGSYQGTRGDETKVIRCQITGGTATSVTFADTINDYITAGIIPNLGVLAGKSYFIIKRDGLWWADREDSKSRWPSWPNGFVVGGPGKQQLWSADLTSATNESLTSHLDTFKNLNCVTFDAGELQSWDKDRWKNYELLVYGSDGYLHRVVITGNNTDTLTFAPQTWTPQGNFIICEPGMRGFPSRRHGVPKWWYSGYQESYRTHLPNDTLGAVNMPVPSILISRGTIEPCDPPDLDDIFDIDYYIPGDDICADQHGDVFLTPDFWKTRRALQISVEGLVGSFTDLQLVSSNPQTLYTLASVLKQANINGQTTTISTVDNMTNVATIAAINMPRKTPGSALETSMTGYFTVYDDDNNVVASGTGTFTSTTLVSGSTLTDALNGFRVVLSWGWTRYWPREFGRYYPATVFIPDNDTGEGGAGIIDPAHVVNLALSGCFGVGQWIFRDRSTSYREKNGFGFDGDSGTAFINGEMARFVGTHWAQPDTGYSTTAPMTRSVADDDDTLPYWDHFTVGERLPTAQSVEDLAHIGRATSGGTNYLTDTDKTWYDTVWYEPSGNMRTESGTASSGSTTTIVDTSKTNNVLQNAHCFWDTGRFDGLAGAYVTFPIKITQDRSGTTTTYHTFITASSQTGANTTITFRAVTGMPAVQSGDTYEINEPYEINRFQQRILRITKSSGEVIETTILGNDDTTLFFDALPDGKFVEAEDGYEIIEAEFGSVFKWNSSTNKWVDLEPGDADPRGHSPGRSDDGFFVDPPAFNLPTTVTWYGRAMSGDYSGIQFSELYAVLNKLYKVPHTGWLWTSCLCEHTGDTCPDCDTDHPNYNLGQNIFSDTWPALQTDLTFSWNSGSNLFPPASSHLENGAPPWALNGAEGFVDEAPGDIVYNLHGSEERSFSHVLLTGIETCMSSSIEYWAYATIDFDDHDEQDVYVSHARTIYHFDANGDNVGYREWRIMGTGAAEFTATRVGPRLGSLNEPNDAPDPTGGVVDGDSVFSLAGYAISDWVAIKNFSPGMTYLDL